MSGFEYKMCVVNSGSFFWLPLPISSFEARQRTRSEQVAVPLVGGQTTLFVERDGFDISISGTIYGFEGGTGGYDVSSAPSAENAHAIKRVMEGYTSGGAVVESPFNGSFSLFRWGDAAYTSCRLQSMSFREGQRNSSIIPYSLEISSDDPYIDLSNVVTDQSDWVQLIGNVGGMR